MKYTLLIFVIRNNFKRISMKKRFVLFASITLLSFFFVIGASAQEKVQDAKKEVKAKTELNKQEIPKKCQECPSLAKCLGEGTKATTAKTTADAKQAEGAACCAGEATAVEAKNDKKKTKAAKQK